jgi:thioredoxin 1
MKTILYFSAEWCGPCHKFKPFFEAQQKAYESISFNVIDCELNEYLADKYDVQKLPTIVFLLDGVEVSRVLGVNEQKLVDALKDFDGLPSTI